MRKTLGIVVAIAASLWALLVLLGLPSINRVEDLTASGAGLELGEWQTGVGIYLTAVLVLGILAVWLLRRRFSTGLTILSWLTFGLLAAVVWLHCSVKFRIGVINQYGHGLTYEAWQGSVVPWTVALVLVGICAISSLVHWRRERGNRSRKGAPPEDMQKRPPLPPGVNGFGE